VEAGAKGFGLGVAAVHVVVEVGGGAGIAGVDVAEEGAAGGGFLLGGHDADVHEIAAAEHAVGVLVDVAVGGIELGAGLAVDDEDVGTLDRRAGGVGVGGDTEGVLVGELVGLETGDEAELADGGLGGDVSCHEDGAVALSDHHVVRQGRCYAGDLDVLGRP